MRNFNRFPAASAAWSAGTEQLAASSGAHLDSVPNAFGTGRAGQSEQVGSFPSFSREPATSWGNGSFNNAPQPSTVDRPASFGFGSPRGAEISASFGSSHGTEAPAWSSSSQEVSSTTPERESIRTKLQRALGGAANRLASMFGGRNKTEQSYGSTPPSFTRQAEAAPSTAWENASAMGQPGNFVGQQAPAESNDGFAARAASAIDGAAGVAHGAADRMGAIRGSRAFQFAERHSNTVAAVGSVIDTVGDVSQAVRGYSAQDIYENREQLASRGIAAAGDMLREGGKAAVREAASTLGEKYGIDVENRRVTSKRKLGIGALRIVTGVGIQHDLMTSAAAGIRAGAGAAKREAVRHATAPSSERGW